MNVLIMSDGLGSRWDNHANRFKQLIDINGVPLICRTIEQVKPFDHNIILIAPEPFNDIIPAGISLTTLGYREHEKRPLLDGILRCKKFWTERTFILLGDVIYSNYAIETIFSVELDSWIMGRCKPNPVTGKKASELFSFVFNPNTENIEYNLKEALKTSYKSM